MASFLSEAWFEEVEGEVPPSGAEVPDLVLQHVVACPDGEVYYQVRVSEGRIRARRGRASDPDVTIFEDYDTAAAVAQGDISAASALLSGRIRVGGNLAALLAAQDRLKVTDPLPAAVRATTTFS